MTKDEGNCPYCSVPNLYSEAVCKSCGEQLPWANWVAARSQRPEAIGATPGSFARKGGQGVSDGGLKLSTGVLGKIVVVIAVLVAGYFALARLTPALHQVSPQGQGGIVEQFKNANPSVSMSS